MRPPLPIVAPADYYLILCCKLVGSVLAGLAANLGSIALLSASVTALELLSLVLLLQSSTEVVIRSIILLKFVVEVFDGPRLFPS